MKKTLLTLLFGIGMLSAILAQENNTDGTVNIHIESTRIIGNQLLVSGKFTAEKKVRVMKLVPKAIAKDGDVHKCTKLWWGGQPASLSIYDAILEPGIPYSFDAAFETMNKDLNPLAAIEFKYFNHTSQIESSIVFKDSKVPSKLDPNLIEGTIEIDKDVYLKWIKCLETPKGLKLNFVVTNKAKKDKIIAFPSYYGNGEVTIIDNDGNQYPKVLLSLKDRVTFPANAPIAGSFEVQESLKMSAVKMLQFKADWVNFSITEIKFPKK